MSLGFKVTWWVKALELCQKTASDNTHKHHRLTTSWGISIHASHVHSCPCFTEEGTEAQSGAVPWADHRSQGDDGWSDEVLYSRW